MYKESSPGSPGIFIVCMVAIDKHAYVYIFSKWFRHFSWYSLLSVTIEFNPIILGEVMMVNVWVGRVKYKPSDVLLIHITHDMLRGL